MNKRSLVEKPIEKINKCIIKCEQYTIDQVRLGNVNFVTKKITGRISSVPFGVIYDEVFYTIDDFKHLQLQLFRNRFASSLVLLQSESGDCEEMTIVDMDVVELTKFNGWYYKLLVDYDGKKKKRFTEKLKQYLFELQVNREFDYKDHINCCLGEEFLDETYYMTESQKQEYARLIYDVCFTKKECDKYWQDNWEGKLNILPHMDESSPYPYYAQQVNRDRDTVWCIVAYVNGQLMGYEVYLR